MIDATANELLTPTEAASYLKVSPRTMADWRRKRVGPPFVRTRRAVRYRKADLDQWLERTRQQPSDPDPSPHRRELPLDHSKLEHARRLAAGSDR